MATRRYDIATDLRITRAVLIIWEQEDPPGADRAVGRQVIRGEAKHATLKGLTSLVLTDYLHLITPDPSGQLPPVTRTQKAAVARLITRRLTGRLHATVLSTEISAQLLTSFIAPPPDQWAQRHSVARSSGEGTWTVSRAKNGAWGCACPRWRFKREPCKHIDAVQQLPEWYPYVPEET